MALLDAVLLVHAAASLLGAGERPGTDPHASPNLMQHDCAACHTLATAGFASSRGEALLPDFPVALSLATDLYAAAVTSLGVIGVLLWRTPPSGLRSQLGAALLLYHCGVVVVSSSHVVAAEPGAEGIQQGLGAVMFHGSLVVWFLMWLLQQRRNAGNHKNK